MKMKMTASMHTIFDKQKWWGKGEKEIECKCCNYLVSPLEVILVQHQATNQDIIHNNSKVNFVICEVTHGP
jgi:hypothetical protein